MKANASSVRLHAKLHNKLYVLQTLRAGKIKKIDFRLNPPIILLKSTPSINTYLHNWVNFSLFLFFRYLHQVIKKNIGGV